MTAETFDDNHAVHLTHTFTLTTNREDVVEAIKALLPETSSFTYTCQGNPDRDRQRIARSAEMARFLARRSGE